MPVEYPVTPLGEIAHIEMGQSPDSATVRDGEGIGVPFLQGNAEFGSLYPSPRFTCLAPMRMCKAGDILISVRAPVGAINIADRDYCIGRGLAAVRVEGMTSRLAAHVISAAAPALRRVAQGTTFEAINKADLASLMVKAPTSTDRAPLSQFLDTLDTTIRQTEAIIEKLKQVKQGLLHDLLTRGIDANGELRPPQSEAPHLYKASPLGWIPDTWEAGTLAQWTKGRPKNGYSPEEAGRWTGTLMLGLGCLTPSGFEPRQLKNAPANDPLVRASLLSDGDLLISRANTRDLVGLAGVFKGLGLPCSYPDLMMRLKPSTDTSAAFLELVLRSQSVRRQIQAAASGTSGSMAKISAAVVQGLRVTMPPLDEQQRVLAALSAANSRIETEIKLRNGLSTMKSGLMDDLLTGRVRITPLLQDHGQSSPEEKV